MHLKQFALILTLTILLKFCQILNFEVEETYKVLKIQLIGHHSNRGCHSQQTDISIHGFY